MSEKLSPDIKDLKVYTVQDLLSERWKKCNLETLERILKQYPLIMEHRSTRKRGTFNELQDSHRKSFFGFNWREDALLREVDIRAFETDPQNSEIVTMVRGDAQIGPLPGKGHRNSKSERHKSAVREIAKQRIREAGDHPESVSFGKPFMEDPEVLKATEGIKYHSSWFNRTLKNVRSKDKSKPGRKKKQYPAFE
jgi:hypothetical protein